MRAPPIAAPKNARATFRGRSLDRCQSVRTNKSPAPMVAASQHSDECHVAETSARGGLSSGGLAIFSKPGCGDRITRDYYACGCRSISARAKLALTSWAIDGDALQTAW